MSFRVCGRKPPLPPMFPPPMKVIHITLYWARLWLCWTNWSWFGEPHQAEACCFGSSTAPLYSLLWSVQETGIKQPRQVLPGKFHSTTLSRANYLETSTASGLYCIPCEMHKNKKCVCLSVCVCVRACVSVCVCLCVCQYVCGYHNYKDRYTITPVWTDYCYFPCHDKSENLLCSESSLEVVVRLGTTGIKAVVSWS